MKWIDHHNAAIHKTNDICNTYIVMHINLTNPHPFSIFKVLLIITKRIPIGGTETVSIKWPLKRLTSNILDGWLLADGIKEFVRKKPENCNNVNPDCITTHKGIHIGALMKGVMNIRSFNIFIQNKKHFYENRKYH